MQLARDAQTSGDPVSAENYFQHAEHYFRLIAAAQEQFRQNNPHLPRQETEVAGARDEGYEDGDGDDDSQQPQVQRKLGRGAVRNRRTALPAARCAALPAPEQPQPVSARATRDARRKNGDIDRLPSFITGGQGAPQPNATGQRTEWPRSARRPLPAASPPAAPSRPAT